MARSTTHTLSDEALAALEAGDPQALIDLHRQTFGGFVMEDEPADDTDEHDDDDLEDEGGDDEDESDEDEGADEDDDEPLGDKGVKALERMKRERRDLKREVRELRSLVEDLRNGDSDEEDELTSARKETQAATTRAVEAEKRLAALTHGLPESWAKRLEGDDLDDFLEDAEALAEDLPADRSTRKGGGGAKEGRRKRKQPSLDDKIAEAEKNGDLAEARRLKAQKVHALHQAQ